jgi:hypothetical protein
MSWVGRRLGAGEDSPRGQVENLLAQATLGRPVRRRAWGRRTGGYYLPTESRSLTSEMAATILLSGPAAWTN